MSAAARLHALRLVGFKSFAERTVVEFGSGISAIVGPNGSGKSNLADALRWTMGEQGRLLRTRRSEDVIFAGSSSRRAIGMADVTLVLENGDRLLPLDYSEVEIGRRLYRSGENEYLLNRQRIRLRDLGELLDAANLADNAFLFIGQGMVDQALALRPEERRPLFEEAAGVRRHERRRRHAEAELAEAESNLERVRDVLAELRPQARRLAAQAEQLQARRSAGHELAEALVAAARARWLTASRAAEESQRALAEAHARADAEMSALRAAEEAAERHSRLLADQAERERSLRTALDAQRAATVELRLSQARLASDIDALERERDRLAQERKAVDERMQAARQRLARPPFQPQRALRDQLEALERQLEGLETEPSSDHEHAAQRRTRLTAELEAQHQRLAELRGRLVRLRERAGSLAAAHAVADDAREKAVGQLQAAVEADAAADAAAQSVRVELERAMARRAESARELAEAEAAFSAGRARLASYEAALAADGDDSLLRAGRARGGRLIAEGLEVEAGLRRAVSAVLGASLRGLAVGESVVPALRDKRGVLLIVDPVRRRTPAAAQAAGESLVAAAVALGGDRLSSAIRRDPQGYVTRLVARSVWLPELADALSLRGSLPPGWQAVTRAGELVSDEGVVQLAPREGVLEQQAARDEQARLVEAAEQQVAARREELGQADGAQWAANKAWSAARETLERARRARRRAEEGERAAQRQAEAALRERAWEEAQLDRLEREERSLIEFVAQTEAQLEELAPTDAGGLDGRRRERLGPQREALGKRRLELAEAVASDEEAGRTDGEARRRAEIDLSLSDTRSSEIEAELERLAERAQEQLARSERLAAELAAAEEKDKRAASELELLLGDEARDRRQLLDAERAASEARERLRRAEAGSRAAEVSLMEARLQLEQVREQLLVELAALGPDGLTALHQAAGAGPAAEVEPAAGVEPTADVEAVEAAETEAGPLEDALGKALDRWVTDGSGEPPPSSGRLAALRRRFHELGAGNPYAVEEYAELKARLEVMEAQRADLEAAIERTRELITNLSRLITDQFLSTFAALEGAFARRFEQLFGGGEAQLSLTQPDDLSATGVEITARPPGKKRQPLAMLSGGERALTAVALLLAMLEVRPVPFCVLDEVDAALDEANISRFSAALRGLADRIQFIVITHNRGTIEAADALYGVTIGDDAVSRIVSLRLPPAGDNGKGRADGPAVIPIEPALETLGS